MSDILKPELIWIEGRCYRIHDPCTEVPPLQEHDMYENELKFNDIKDDEEDEFEILMIDNTRYSTNFHVSKYYIGAIIGKKGAVKNRIERDTRTEIKIPKQGQDGDIIIFGASASNVKAARRRINIIVMSSRMKQTPTHFISIPLNRQNIMKNFEDFKESVLRDCQRPGLEESIFIKPQKLHITLGTLCLMDNEERLFASKLLTDAKDKLIMPLLKDRLPLKFRVKGLSYMNDDPKQIDVLYGQVQEEDGECGIIQTLADSIVEYFYKAGLMFKEYDRDHVKLHITFINTKYRGSSSSSGGDNGDQATYGRKKRQPFDGSLILQKYADYDFGVAELTDIQLSQRHYFGPDGYYQPTCIISCDKSYFQ